MPRCKLRGVATSSEIAGMLLRGPEAAEYRDEDVYRGLQALGVDVTPEDVHEHRRDRCGCRA